MKRSMDDLLRETLRAREAGPAACLDADGAAAFVEGAMSARERVTAEEHLADCPRCQAFVAAIVRTTPAPARRIWWRRPAVAWLAPLTVAATALAIWINMRDNGAVRPEAARESTVASALERPTLGRAPTCRESRRRPRCRRRRSTGSRSRCLIPHRPRPPCLQRNGSERQHAWRRRRQPSRKLLRPMPPRIARPTPGRRRGLRRPWK